MVMMPSSGDPDNRLIERVVAEAAGTPQDGGEVIGASLICGQRVQSRQEA